MFKYLPQICFNPDPPPPGPTPAWHDGEAPELIGHAQNHGWHAMDAGAAAKAALKAHYEANKLIGVPADQLLRLPKDMNDPAQLTPIYERLGHPKEAKEYDFTGIKRADGSDLDEALVGVIRNSAFEHRIPKSAATTFAKNIVAHLDAVEGAKASERTAKLMQERAELKQEWAAAPEVNKLLAQAAANRLGVTDEEITALESQIGYKRVMQMFRTIGERLGEHDYLLPKLNGKTAPMTREQAVTRMEELKRDADWGTRWMNGGTAEKAEMENLQRIIAG